MSSTFTSTVGMLAPGKAVHAGVNKAIFNKPGPMTLTVSSSNDRVLLLNIPNKATITDFYVKVAHEGVTGGQSKFKLRLLQSAQNLVSYSASLSDFVLSPQMAGRLALADVVVPFRVSLTDSGTIMETLSLDIESGTGSTTTTLSVIGWIEYVMDDQILV